ncbi:TNR1B factor, partial [Penelope pileata]|nr:TNR1B factor [Penelope pileata]
MGPRWVLLAALLRSAGGRDYSLPYTPESAQCKDPSTEFYEERLNKCCSKCPPGQYKAKSCSHSVDTKCIPCRPNTYTAVWNRSPQCFACSPPCGRGFVQNQTCTLSQDRICSCPPNEYCISKIYQSCQICKAHRKCGKGFRVSRRGTDSTDTECKPCPPGTFSDEESYDTSCMPHTVCKSVAVPGNSMDDTVCSDSGRAVATVLPHTVVNLLLSQSSASNKPEVMTQSVILSSVPDMSYIIVTGPLFLVLIIAVLGCCLISKKKAFLKILMFCTFLPLFQPFSPTEKQCDKKVRNTGSQNSSSSEQEEQHLLETPGSSSSSLTNPAGPARVSVTNNKNKEKKETERFPQHFSAAEGCKLHSGDRHSSASSEHSGNGGTQVNVTCIVKVCNPDCGSQFPEQTGPPGTDYGSAPCSPTGGEFPFSKEENPLRKETEIQISVEAEENLLQDLLPEEKKFPLDTQDVGMKTN